MELKKRYWVEDENELYSFSSKEKRDNFVKQSDTVLANQLAPDGLYVFTTATVFEGTINKYIKLKE